MDTNTHEDTDTEYTLVKRKKKKKKERKNERKNTCRDKKKSVKGNEHIYETWKLRRESES